MKVPKQRIENASATEKTRYTMQGVYLDVENQVLVATNGHILAAVPAEIEKGDAMKRVKPLLREAARASIAALKKTIVRAPNGETTAWQRPVGRFPNPWQKVLPKTTGAPDVVFNLALLCRLADALRAGPLTKGMEGSEAMVRLWIDKKAQPSTSGILVAVGNELQGVGVLMPMRDNGMTAEKVLAFLKPKAATAPAAPAVTAAPLCTCACHERTQKPEPCFYCANTHNFEGARWTPAPAAAATVEGGK